IRILAEYVAAPLKVGGIAVLWKGPSWVEELRTAQNALAKLRLAFKENHDYFLDDRFRTLVVLGKEAPTPHGFPRKAGIPEKRPL
ncbi:MAG: 16S rRNA (guanine(527)-N(7))-methyltransferase RsmG, partial [Coprothermobacter proteolyticus]